MDRIAELEAALERMTEWLEAEARCPCCEEMRECLEGCTFAEDAPSDAARMAGARVAMYGA